MNAANFTDEQLAEKFRKEYSEQFNVLVRMHLSFVLDLNTEENDCLNDRIKLKKWKLVPFGKKTKSTEILEGAALSPEKLCMIYQLFEYLKNEQNLKVEGIFRRTGSLNRQNELKSLLNKGTVVDFDSGIYSVHDCASVFKQFLAELPDPLLTESNFPAYCQIAELCGVIEKPTHEEKLLEALQLILLLLPSENLSLLKDILYLLQLTTTYEYSNKMSADNLATLFTPHLLCPRKLSAEQLHSNSQNLCGIISFMITHCDSIFQLPKKLLVDFRVCFDKKVLQSNMCLNESVNDQFAANTVFTFLDQERTAKENESNPTETALAQLYAHIQSLPESSKKKKLVKQFNKENGHGTPLQVLRSSAPKNKSLGDSIKKHILNKKLIRSIKKSDLPRVRSSSEEVLNTPPQGILSRARLFCTNCDPSPEKCAENEDCLLEKTELTSNPFETCNNSLSDKQIRKSISEPNLTNEGIDHFNNSYLTSTPACFPLHSRMESLVIPEESDRKSMSPISRSTQRMTLAMQESMMTPRSRKPVLLCGNNLNNLPKIDQIQTVIDNETPHKNSDSSNSETNCTKFSLTNTFREYLNSRDILTCSSNSPKDLSFSSRTDDFTTDEFHDFSETRMSRSLLQCLNGENPNCDDKEEKELVLKPKQFDENGKPIVYETSF